MALDKIFVTFLGVELLFLISGALVIIFALVTQAQEAKPFTVTNVARDLLLGECPIKGRFVSFRPCDALETDHTFPFNSIDR